MKVLETERLVVRHFRAEDLDALSAVAADPEVMRYVGDGRPITREQARVWIERSLANYARHGFGSFAVALKEDEGGLVGYCGLVNLSADGEAEIVYGFAEPYWGRGLARELAGPLIDFGFGPCGLRRIVATIDPENVASVRVVERWGMKLAEQRLDEHGLPEALYVVERPPRDESA
jgi:RimJ/RimL family protein N-acetyltransferase